MGIPIVYNTNILKEQPFLAILGPGINFWAGQEESGVGQFFFLLF